MKKQIMTILSIMIITLMIASVQAGLLGDIIGGIGDLFGLKDGKITLPTEVSNSLKSKGISNINIETLEDDNNYYVKSTGDIKEDLVTIPKQVKDYCIKLDIVKRISKYKVIHERPCSGVWAYRDITDEEVKLLTQRAVESKLNTKADIKKEVLPIEKSTKFVDIPIKI